MGARLGLAKAASSLLTWGLRNIARRPAANTPGLIGLKIDPTLIADLRGRMREGSIVVVGTNGKTTVTNLLANTLEQQGFSVLCNRTGANLNSGIASALLQTKQADWGVLECDELWSAKIVPQLRPTYFLLLNLFRDQLDRCGEIDHIQDAIVSGLVASPETTLIYNADDPLCEMIAQRVVQERGTNLAGFRPIPFGTLESMGLEQNQVADATMCQRCLHMFHYEYRQYGQLGAYECPNCGFTRPPLAFAATDIHLVPGNLEFDVVDMRDSQECDKGSGLTSHSEQDAESASLQQIHIHTKLNGTYMVYNMLAIAAAATTIGCSPESITQAISAFDPKNGRLQDYNIRGRKTLLNLAKNPTGFNQNLRIVNADHGPKAVAFFINDKVVDGHDISWIWDIDFEELTGQRDTLVFAGGTRKNDLQVRLKYAGVSAQLVDGIEDVFAAMAEDAQMPSDAPVYAIANYTALPPVHDALDKMQAAEAAGENMSGDGVNDICDIKPDPLSHPTQDSRPPVVIAHVLPDLLNLYGDGGNVRVLQKRLEWRGIPVEVRRFTYDDPIDLANVDLVVLGGSPDREQRLALERLKPVAADLQRFVEEDGPLLAICGGYQMLGRVWVLDGEEVPGLGILPMDTRRPGASTDRMIDNIALSSDLATHPVIGYENHSGRTYLDEDARPFGKVVSNTGHGNNDDSAQGEAFDGIQYKAAIGTYLHGPLLSKNPEVADVLLQRACDHAAKRSGAGPTELKPLDDSVELAANAFMAHKLGA